MSSPVDLCKMLKNKLYEQFGKMNKKIVRSQKKPARVSTLLKQHIFRLVRASKLVSKNQEVARVPPVNTIFKKQKRGISAKKRKAIGKLKGSELVEFCCESAKHLSFPAKDGTLVHGRRCLPLQLPHLQTFCKIVSDVLAASSAMGNLNTSQCAAEGAQLNLNDKGAQLNLNDKGAQLNLNDKVVISSVETGETSSEKQPTGCYGYETNTNSSITKNSPLAEFDLNHPVQDCVDLNCDSLDESTLSPSPIYARDQKFLSPMNNAGFNSDAGTCQEPTFSLTSEHVNRLHNPIRRFASVSDANCAQSIIRNGDKQYWISCLDQSSMVSTERQTHPMDSMRDVPNDFPGFQPVYHIPKDMLISTCSSVGSEAIVEPQLHLGPIWRDTCTEEGFIGLPLNSQGELIQLHPGNRSDFCEVDKMPSPALNSLQILPSSSYFQTQSSHVRTKGKLPSASFYHEDGQHWFLKQYHPASKVVISDLGSPELQGLEKVKYQHCDDKAQFDGCDSRQMETCFCGCRNHIVTDNCFDRLKSHPERDLGLGIQPAFQPTMRLMGKNVTVGSYSKEHQRCNDGKIWSDKEIMTTSCPSRRVSMSWNDEECLVQSNPGASRGIPFNSLEGPSTSNDMHLNYVSNWMLKDGNLNSGNHGILIDLSQSAVACQSFLNSASHSAVHYTPETQSWDMGQRKTFWASYPQNIGQHMLLNSTHCKHGQTVSYSIPSTSYPTYTNQVPVQTPRRLSSQNVPHWLLNTSSQHPPFIPYHPVAAYQSCSIPTDSAFSYASPYSRSVISFPCGSNSISQYGSYAPKPAVYCTSTAGLTTDNFRSMSSTYGHNVRAKDGVGFNFSCVKNQDRSDRYRKRPAARDDKMMETVKRPNLKLQRDSNTPTSVRREQLHGDRIDNLGESGINDHVSEKIDVSLPVMDNSEINARASRKIVSGGTFLLKSSHTRSGPVKLSAGAKHILRPNESLDQEKNCPIYSTVPFTQGGGKDAVSQEKAAEVYRF